MKIKGRENYKPGPKDECGSPPYAVIPLINSIELHRTSLGIPKNEFVIWEPAIGLTDKKHNGLLSGLISLGYATIGTTEDFITADIDEVQERLGYGLKIRMIVTNPPFSVKLKREFINKCESIFVRRGIPYALLMNTTTLVEKINGNTLQGCAVHIPCGRICFNMPNKGWGTVDNPTKSTFATNWFSVGLADPYAIYYDSFDMSDHFAALERFNKMLIDGSY